jgi:uncharacterized membrane protein
MNCCCGTGKNTTGQNKKKRSTAVFFLLALLAIGTIIYLVDSGSVAGNRTTGTAEAAVTPVVSATEVTFPGSAFEDGKAKFFAYKTSDGKTVKYFVIKSSDGVIRAAFDACDVCWESGKGYKQDGDFMVCQNCGRRFQSTKVNVVTGGCNPSALTRTMKDGKVTITVQALNEGKRLFK